MVAILFRPECVNTHLYTFAGYDQFIVWFSSKRVLTTIGYLCNNCVLFCFLSTNCHVISEMCSERDSPLKRLYRRTHAKRARLACSGQLVWAAGCELSLARVHARRPAWPGETSETILWMAPPRKTRPPDHTRVNWPVDASCFRVSTGGPRWAPQMSCTSSGWPGAGKTKGLRGLSLSLHISGNMQVIHFI